MHQIMGLFFLPPSHLVVYQVLPCASVAGGVSRPRSGVLVRDTTYQVPRCSVQWHTYCPRTTAQLGAVFVYPVLIWHTSIIRSISIPVPTATVIPTAAAPARRPLWLLLNWLLAILPSSLRCCDFSNPRSEEPHQITGQEKRERSQTGSGCNVHHGLPWACM